MKTIRASLVSKLVSCLLLLAFTVSTLAQTAPPKAEAREVKDTYFGTTISDSYRWMENLKSEEVQNWIKAQADYSRGNSDQQLDYRRTRSVWRGSQRRWSQQRCPRRNNPEWRSQHSGIRHVQNRGRLQEPAGDGRVSQSQRRSEVSGGDADSRYQ
jgi:hypothetical protein